MTNYVILHHLQRIVILQTRWDTNVMIPLNIYLNMINFAVILCQVFLHSLASRY